MPGITLIGYDKYGLRIKICWVKIEKNLGGFSKNRRLFANNLKFYAQI